MFDTGRSRRGIMRNFHGRCGQMGLALWLAMGVGVVAARDGRLRQVRSPQGGGATPIDARVRPVERPAAPADPKAPKMSLDANSDYSAVITTAKGEIDLQLYPTEAPITVNSFVYLARKHFFDGLTFHRVVPDFVIQGGDPVGDGTGGPGYEFQNENNAHRFDGPGVLAMANAGPNTNGSQFFITMTPQPHLDGGYTIFGHVTKGQDVVSQIAVGDVMKTVTITQTPKNGAPATAPAK